MQIVVFVVPRHYFIALISLVVEKNYDSITIQKILDRPDIVNLDFAFSPYDLIEHLFQALSKERPSLRVQ